MLSIVAITLCPRFEREKPSCHQIRGRKKSPPSSQTVTILPFLYHHLPSMILTFSIKSVNRTLIKAQSTPNPQHPMADQGSTARPVEEGQLKSKVEVAFEAIFKALEDKSKGSPIAKDPSSDSLSEDKYEEDVASKSIGPPNLSKGLVVGTGIAGSAACSPSSFVVTTKNTYGQCVPRNSTLVRIYISLGISIGGIDQMVQSMTRVMARSTSTSIATPI